MLDISRVRQRSPSLGQIQDGQPIVFFDNPGGTQVPQVVIDAMTGYLQNNNANHGRVFPTSQRRNAMLDAAHRAMVDMLGAASPDKLIFGSNMITARYN
jgi:selenocysteine lyase/cysteine desulfurase